MHYIRRCAPCLRWVGRLRNISAWAQLTAQTISEFWTTNPARSALPGRGRLSISRLRWLLYEVADVGAAACSASCAARVAGRCSVFAKTDMIHAQQKGYTADQICAGCARRWRETSSPALERAAGRFTRGVCWWSGAECWGARCGPGGLQASGIRFSGSRTAPLDDGAGREHARG